MVRRFGVAVIIALFLAFGSGPVAAQGTAQHAHHHPHATAPTQPTFLMLPIALATPSAPQSLVVHPNGISIGLTWKAVPGATSYSIYRGASAQGEGDTPYIKGITSPSFTNTKVTKDTLYYYQVTAVNSSGESARSNEAFATPEGIPVPVSVPPTHVQSNNVGAILGILLGLLFLTLAVVGGIIFFRRRGQTSPVPPPPPLSAGDTIVARGLFDPPTTPVSSWQSFPGSDDNGDTTTIVPYDQRQLAPLGDAPIWPTAPLRSGGDGGDRQPSSGSVGLIVAIVLIALGILGIGLFAYFAATSGNAGGRGTLPAATSTTVAVATFTPTLPPSPTVIPPLAVNAGGGVVGNFSADMNMHGGDTDSTANPIDTNGVNNAAPPTVYQSERWGDFSYIFTNLAPGSSYTVQLHFAEIYFTDPGQRMFNVSINGKRVLDNFDIIAEAGAPNRAVVQDFPATVTGDGKITIHFSDGDANHAKVSGIELIPNG